uniref:Uncharacterized protein n=1 Tax=Arundo donax TaxID=35708 RepID=A0A0A9EUV1_ARUDO
MPSLPPSPAGAQVYLLSLLVARPLVHLLEFPLHLPHSVIPMICFVGFHWLVQFSVGINFWWIFWPPIFVKHARND